jgi:glutamine synthetase
MKYFGKGNESRILGKHETSTWDDFTWGVSDRGSSIRIPRLVNLEGKGYFEDRRPSANLNPYLVFTRFYLSLFE